MEENKAAMEDRGCYSRSGKGPLIRGHLSRDLKH